jgi:hypothetical protein
MQVTSTDQLARIDAAIDAGVRRLLELQSPGGWWVGELESNVTMTAQHLFWHHFLGLRTPELDRRIAAELLARMREDGTWSIWWEGPPDLSTTVEAYVALRIAGVDPGDKTRAYINAMGGIPKVRVFTKCFLALVDQWPWQRIPPVPVEMVLLPPSAPFSIYNLACWARQTVVPLAGVMALRPIRRVDVDLTDICAAARSTRPRSGSASARRPTAAGAASSPRGCGACSSWPAAAVASTTRSSSRRTTAGRASWSRRATGCVPRPASRRCGTPGWRCSVSGRAASRPTIRSCAAPPTGCWPKRSR